MARPAKLRCVAQFPNVGFFRPVGVPMNALQGVCLSLEEVETLIKTFFCNDHIIDNQHLGIYDDVRETVPPSMI